jgi:ferrous iron transport protein A
MKTLNEIEEGKKVKVKEILGGFGVRQHLSTHGIHIGDIVLIKRSSVWGGPIIIEVHGSKVALGRGIAFKIEVEEL